ncbi:pentatricopeptide repeat-containing protein At3g09040, mitochondrial [Macadamia integrifolia]|uniref:pentatricopeptide repeat-containing protein At3g09040, mitochondrial n=1 Tax=Macadamia integrifolia TaxID=60698 RepID=UPI001C4F15E9|nr:pentatricopeptide repeat-containing protein At3g09040, mitochondrial [Macadamia integrifolia]XP_042489276.1 pentatricopeptide repeat-containing protein At3g09040, mitochondrial [Macadamia integrifolia]XP_042489277.1 pentatricopeptide repeat-containing protein At3g09040, mitochondrial [Macadamia integrifolia]
MRHVTNVRNFHILKSPSIFRVKFSNISQPNEQLDQNIQLGFIPESNLYTRLIKACLQECKLIQSHRLLDQMPQQKQKSYKNSKVLHAQIVKVGLGLSGKLGNVIVDLYSKCGNVDFAQKLFDRLDRRDGLAWNSILSLYSRCGKLEDIILAFGSMWNSCTPPNQFTFAIVLSACGRLMAVGPGRQVHCNIIKMGFEFNSFCEGSLIDMYAKSDYVTDARKIFDRAVDPDTVSWTAMIAGYVRTGMPEEALKLFKEVQDLGHEPDQVAFGTIITAYVGLRRLDDACRVFAQMPNPNVVAWNVMISGHAQSGYSVEAINFFHDMRASGVKFTRSTLGSVLSAIASLAALDQGLQVHSEAIRLGLDSNVFVGSALINMYAKCQTMEDARKVFDSVIERNIVLWNAMLGGYANNGYPCQVFDLFSDMRDCGLQLDEFTYTSLLSACACLENLEMGRQLHSFLIKSNFESSLFVENAMVDMYAKSGDLKDARQQFELIHDRDNVSWNAIIVGYVHEEYEDEAFIMFQKMILDGIAPDEVSLASILSACANIQALELGKQFHCFAVKYGLDLNLYAGSSLVDMYAKCGDMQAANVVLARMPEQGVVSRNALIAGYAQNNDMEEAVNYFQEMQAAGLKPSKFTFTSILPVCSGPSRVDMGRQVHCYTIKSGFLQDDDFLGIALLGMYLKSQNSEDANKIFSEFPDPKSTVLWTAIISGYAQDGYSEEALWFFREMHSCNVVADEATFASVLSACACSAALKDGREVHSLIIRSGFNSDECMGSALVDMYAKCGDMKSSVQSFEEMDSKQDVISWNSMIVGFAKNGYADDALKIFDLMKHALVKPDDVTFLGVLTACSHAGLISEGCELFDIMMNNYGIQPRVDHYACMIDLLGRSGHLKEADEFIKKLPFEPSAEIWATFLASCRQHGDYERGQWAAEKLIELEPQNSSPYVLLSNIYAAAGNWNGVNTVRKAMKERSVKKMPGCSWIAVGKKTSMFSAADKFHPNASEIYAVLKDLTALMKEEGYIVSAHSVLHDEE